MDQDSINNFLGQENQDSGFNLWEIFFLFLRNWYWLVLGGGIAFAVAWFQLRYAIPIYSVKGTLLIKDQSSNGLLSEDMIVSDLGFNTRLDINNELELLKSRNMMRDVVDTLKLHISYFAEGRIKTSEIYQATPFKLVILSPEQEAYNTTFRIKPHDATSFALIQGETDTLIHRYDFPFVFNKAQFAVRKTNVITPDNITRIQIRHPESVAQSYANRLNIQTIGRSDVLTIRLQDAVPQKAIDIINTLVEVYNQSNIEDKQLAGQKTLAFIDERLDSISAKLLEVEKEVEGYKRKEDLPIDIAARAQIFIDQITTQDQAIAEIDLQKGLLENIASFFQMDKDRFQALPISSTILQGTLATLVAEYNKLILEREQLLNSATTLNPATGLLLAQMENLRENILLSVQNNLQELENRRNQLVKQLDPIIDRISGIPTNERELLQIMRQQKIRETLYLYLLQKREETALSNAAQVSNSRIIDNATLQGQVSPNSRRKYLLNLLLGIGLPAAIIYLLALLDNKIYSERDIKQLTDTPFIGAIGRPSKEQQLVVNKGSRSSVAEMFRLLRTNLQYLAPEKDHSIIMVTSGTSGEGKTFISVNLGASMALSGKKTILLGFDLRKPKLSEYILGERMPKGISNYLVGQASLNELVVPTQLDGLFVLPCGPVPPNPAELIMNSRTDQLFQELRESFDAIIIDTAPVGLVTDALLLSTHTIISLYVTRFGKTVKPSLKIIDDIYEENKLPHPCIVINDVKRQKGYYGYNKSYGYGGYGLAYGYGAGYYTDEKTKKSWWPWKK